MRHETDIKKDYRPKWGFWEGVREVIQNAKDAQTEHGARMTVEYRGSMLVVHNEGCTLDREALLFGHSSKVGREELIGQHGDGFKVGMLALVRAGHRVTVRTGSESWKPSIQRSNTFKADVLVWQITTGLVYQNEVTISLTCLASQWANVKGRFLFLRQPHPNDVKTEWGTLLGAPDLDGSVFVKGIFVFHDEKLQNGYDLKKGKVDIDRKMVEDNDLRWRVANILSAASQSIAHADRTLAMIEDNAKDADYLRYLGEVPTPLADRAAEKFFNRFGSLAIPVGSLEQAARLEHLGRRGIVVGDIMRNILSVRVASYESIINSLDARIKHTFTSRDDLAPNELASLHAARMLLQAAGVEETYHVNVVDFVDQTLGLYANGEVYLSRATLANKHSALETLVHEVAHHLGGGDGEKSHVVHIERIWSQIVEHLWR